MVHFVVMAAVGLQKLVIMEQIQFHHCSLMVLNVLQMVLHVPIVRPLVSLLLKIHLLVQVIHITLQIMEIVRMIRINIERLLIHSPQVVLVEYYQ
jgi:hypothetical protein